MIPVELAVLALKLVERLIESGHPDPKGALETLLSGVELAAQLEAKEKFG